MKKISYFIVSALTTVGLVSCSLDAENLKEATTENYPASEGDATSVLAAVYENLNQVSATPQESFYYISMLASDDNLGGGGANDKLMQSEDLLLNYNANATEQFFKDRYQGIGRANTAIQAFSNNTRLDSAFVAKSKGECLFLRAFYYYELASQYGNVPLTTEPTDKAPVQGNVKVLWGQILQDLCEAAKLMPAVKRTDGHVDRYCAEAMLGRAWLFYTGMYGNGETLADLTSTTYKPLTEVALPNGFTLTKDSVISAINDCVNNSGYSLVTSDYRNLWAYTNRCTVGKYDYTKDVKDKDGNSVQLKWVEDDNAINPESMFAIKFNKTASWNTTIGYANGYALHFGMRGGQDLANTFPFGQGWGAGPVAPNLVTEWKEDEPNDPRLEASVQDVRKLPKYTYGAASWKDFVQETNYFEKKQAPISGYDDSGNLLECFEEAMYGNKGWSNGTNFQTSNIHDLVLIRFADVLLMHSELTDGAIIPKFKMSGMNYVRSRVGLAAKPYSLENLQKERRHELAFEGVRWNDIRRWHIAAAKLEKQTNEPIYIKGNAKTNVAVNGGYASRYNATAGFFKMPENQVSLGTVVQNEGWSSSDAEYQGWPEN